MVKANTSKKGPVFKKSTCFYFLYLYAFRSNWCILVTNLSILHASYNHSIH